MYLYARNEYHCKEKKTAKYIFISGFLNVPFAARYVQIVLENKLSIVKL